MKRSLKIMLVEAMSYRGIAVALFVEERPACLLLELSHNAIIILQ